MAKREGIGPAAQASPGGADKEEVVSTVGFTLLREDNTRLRVAARSTVARLLDAFRDVEITHARIRYITSDLTAALDVDGGLAVDGQLDPAVERAAVGPAAEIGLLTLGSHGGQPALFYAGGRLDLSNGGWRHGRWGSFELDAGTGFSLATPEQPGAAPNQNAEKAR
jgi:hypothetical protein